VAARTEPTTTAIDTEGLDRVDDEAEVGGDKQCEESNDRPGRASGREHGVCQSDQDS
jgi:hypothetical protein